MSELVVLYSYALDGCGSGGMAVWFPDPAVYTLFDLGQDTDTVLCVNGYYLMGRM